MADLSRLDCVNDEFIAWKYSPILDGWIFGNLSRIDKAILSPSAGRIGTALEILVTNWSLVVRVTCGQYSQELRYSYSSISSIGVYGSWGAPLKCFFNDGFAIEFVSTRPHLRGIELWEKIALVVIGVCGAQSDLQKAIDLVRAITVSSLRQPDDFVPSLTSTDKFYNYLRFPVNCPPSLDEAYIRIKSPQAFKKLENESVSTSASILSGDVNSDTWKFMDVVLPRIHGDSYSGHIHGWHMSQGTRVNKGEALFSVQWCGQIVNIRSSYNGILLRILTPIRGPVVSGQRVAVIKAICDASPQVRIYELSRELGLENKAVLDAAEKLGFAAKSYSSSISGDEASRIRSLIEGVPHGSKVAKDTLATQAISHLAITSSEKQSHLITTTSAIKAGGLSVVAGETPQFQPSAASIPKGFQSTGTYEADLRLCLASNALDIQSFFNDLNIFGADDSIFVSDDILSLPCFDESLYCNIVKQMHRYSLAELADNKDQLAKDNAGLGAMVGSLVGLMTGNIFAPFLGHSVGKNLTDQTTKISEFLPDPLLLFYEDHNSYLSWNRGQVSSPKLRRLILDRQISHDGTVFFRAIPAIVTADSILPIQLFKSGHSSYFYRPFSAGIERTQANYDAIRIQRKYFHARHEGDAARTDIAIPIRGKDVEPSEQNFFRFTGPSRDYFYLDFQIQPGSVF
jgi:hypothetical protein